MLESQTNRKQSNWWKKYAFETKYIEHSIDTMCVLYTLKLIRNICMWCGNGETIWIWNKKPHPWHNCISCWEMHRHRHRQLASAVTNVTGPRSMETKTDFFFFCSNKYLICYVLHKERDREREKPRGWYAVWSWAVTRNSHRLHGIRNVEKAKQTIVS